MDDENSVELAPYDRAYYEGFVRELNELQKKWDVDLGISGGSLDARYELLPLDTYRDGWAIVSKVYEGDWRLDVWHK